MTNYICEDCNKDLLQKSKYDKHKIRKTPCKQILKTPSNTQLNTPKKENSILEFSKISKEITKNITKKEKKDDGIYFTPPSIIQVNIELLKAYITDTTKILEPSCGSCEYINALHKYNNRLKIVGIEFNKIVYEGIQGICGENIELINMNFLDYNPENKFDLIIGNPPYYVMKSTLVKKDYFDYFDGRPNIFILFIVRSCQLLNENGILSFVLPKNFINCLYYEKLRKYINTNFKIIELIDCSDDKYIETQQDTIIFIIKKEKDADNNDFVIKINNYSILNTKENILKLKKLYENANSLNNLGFKVSVGSVVWNQVKDILTDDETKTRLIYSSDIENNKLIQKKFTNGEKKNFINKKGINEIRMIINRGYGVGKYTFNYCLINEKFEYLLENHVISISYKLPLKKEELLVLYKKIMKSLENDKTKEFVNLYFGNNAVNSTELNNILPIYSE